ncbi:MAG: hypothetical protein E7291_03885 [Lachnospiraceae bacterium]|nr:hypothetical protein [Lachnospiraceae bacterium]
MRKKILHNLGLKLASLVLAFVLWFLVVQIDDPKETERFNNVQVKLTNTELLEKEGKVYEVLDNTDVVRVTVSAPRSILTELRASDIVAEADMSKLTDINTIAISYSVQGAEVTSIEGDHEVVRLNVENKKSKWIKLIGNTVGEVEEGYIVSNAYLDQTNIEISGPESAISTVDHAGVDISVAGASTSLSANIDIKLYDAEGNEIENDNIKKNVNYAHMTVEVLATKDVPIKIQYMGEPAEGYLATGVVEGTMSRVVIAGTNAALANVSAVTIPAERLDISGATGDVVEVVDLEEYLPTNIKFADKKFNGRITATIYIEPVEEKDMEIPAENITIRNLPEGYTAELPVDIEKYSLTVSGLNQFVAPLQQNTVTGVLDIMAWMVDEEMTELRGGTYNIPVVFNLSEDITVETPVAVSVTISETEDL